VDLRRLSSLDEVRVINALTADFNKYIKFIKLGNCENAGPEGLRALPPSQAKALTVCD
jgi:hypothetical protein